MPVEWFYHSSTKDKCQSSDFIIQVRKTGVSRVILPFKYERLVSVERFYHSSAEDLVPSDFIIQVRKTSSRQVE